MYIQRDKIIEFFRPGVQEVYVKNFGLTYEEANVAAEALIIGVSRSIDHMDMSGNPDRLAKILGDKIARLLPKADGNVCHGCRHKMMCRYIYEWEKLQEAFGQGIALRISRCNNHDPIKEDR